MKQQCKNCTYYRPVRATRGECKYGEESRDDPDSLMWPTYSRCPDWEIRTGKEEE